MKILLKSAIVVDEASPFDGERVDLLIEDGTIRKIAPLISQGADNTLTHARLHLSPGWYDAHVHFCDPGNEVTEDIASGSRAAAFGGMTAVSPIPHTHPPIDHKSQVAYLLERSDHTPLDLYPYGAITVKDGQQLAEMYDLFQSGAVAFMEAQDDVNAGVLYRALLYVKHFGGKIITRPFDPSLVGKGHINEGKVSILTGLKPIPAISEYLRVQRDLAILKYTDSSLHFTGVSCRESVDHIRAAKRDGLQVTADVYVMNLLFTEDALSSFDTQFKLFPPLRSEKDRQALIEAVKDGTIDMVCSNHLPQDREHKDTVFENARFGAIGTQTLFALYNKLTEISLSKKVQTLCANPRRVMQLPTPCVQEGEVANLTLFDPDAEWRLKASDILSKSANTPLIDQPLKGRVIGTLHKGKLNLVE